MFARRFRQFVSATSRGGRGEHARLHFATAFAAVVSASSVTYIQWCTDKRSWRQLNVRAEDTCPATPANPALPTYTRDEVKRHTNVDVGIWVTYGNGVYDVTDFVHAHPGGGERLLQAAGGALEPFWNLYSQHKKTDVLELLETMRIGNLRDETTQTQLPAVPRPAAYANEPARDKRGLIVHSEAPFTAEPSAEALIDTFVTPNDIFYTRNHLPVPEIDLNKYRIEIDATGRAPVFLSLPQLRSTFANRHIVAAIQCGGNRRLGFMEFNNAVKGVPWRVGAIGNALWGGVSLRDVIQSTIGVDNIADAHSRGYFHVIFEGLDRDERGEPYTVSVPTAIALDPQAHALLATEMNGQPLPRDHGFPVRVVIPGVVGARQVKWLGAIRLREDESDSQHQKKDYKLFSPSSDWTALDWSAAPAMQRMPVQSAICWPADGSTVSTMTPDNVLRNVRGYAFSGVNEIIRVDVSGDGGRTWQIATLESIPSSVANADSTSGSWRRWRADVPLARDSATATVMVKAVDGNYNTQPMSRGDIFNMRGLANTSWHTVQFKVEARPNQQQE